MIHYRISDEVCVLRLDSPPLGTLTFPLLEELRDAIGRANREPGVRAIVLMGEATHFSAGADINLFQQISCAEDAVRVSRVFQEAFQEVEDSPKPLAAALAGRVLGGALELALACHFRVCAKGTTFNMPEVNLGISPGAGGTQRLPRLIGIEAALRMLLTAEMVGAEQALAYGLVDAVCDGSELEQCARNVLRGVAAPRPTSRLTDKMRDAAASELALRQAEKRLAGVRPELIAPRKIVETVAVGLKESFQAGLRKEQEAFAECIATPAARNKIYLFFATRQTGKLPQPTSEVARAAVVGMGTMGTGIAQALLSAGLPVLVIDQSDAIVSRAVERIGASLGRRVEQGKLSAERAADMLRLITPTTRWPDLAAADLIVEAVYEDVVAKRSVIGRIEEVCTAEAVIATNTSTISLDVLAEGMRHGERLIGMHFFHPAQRMPLVEIVRREATPGRVIATALQLAKGMRKTPVLVNSREGFVVNRLFIPYLKEAFWLLEEGAQPGAIDAAMVEFGFAMGPLALIDMAGIDVLVLTDKVMSRAFPRHGCLSPVAVRLVERGHLGQKTAAGVYKYRQGDYTPRVHEITGQIVAEVQRENGRTAREIHNDEITERLVLRMVGEAFCVLEEKIALRPSDVDVATVLGSGFPDFRGGVLKYAHDLGLDNVASRLDVLAAQCGERFSPCRFLRETIGA